MKILLPILSAALLRAADPLAPFLENNTVVGYSYLVQRDGKVLAEGRAGFQDREKAVPLAPDTIFEIMSMTKPVTVAGVMLLVEDGKLTLDDPVSKHLPEFRDTWQLDASSSTTERKLVKPARPITVRDLMTHTSGMPEYRPPFMDTYRSYSHTLREATWVDSRLPLVCAPGACFQYSNTGLATLGRLIETLSGQKYEDFLAQRLFQPLGLNDTFFFPQPEHEKRIAMVYNVNQGKLVPGGPVVYRRGAIYACPECGLYSTLTDMAKWHRLFADNGAFEGRQILKPETVAEMARNQTAGLTPSPGKKIPARGLGWGFYENGWVGHGGAFGTMGMYDPKTRTVAILMIQRLGGYDAVQKAFRDMVLAIPQ